PRIPRGTTAARSVPVRPRSARASRRTRPRSASVRRSPPAPVQVLVDLPGSLQVLELREPGEGAEFVGLAREVDALEQPVQFLGALVRGPLRAEPRQLRRDLVERDAVAAVVLARRTGADLAPRK